MLENIKEKRPAKSALGKRKKYIFLNDLSTPKEEIPELVI